MVRIWRMLKHLKKPRGCPQRYPNGNFARKHRAVAGLSSAWFHDCIYAPGNRIHREHTLSAVCVFVFATARRFAERTLKLL